MKRVYSILLMAIVFAGMASAVECPPGFEWKRMSGVGCVQSDCFEVGASWSYTQACICRDKVECFEEVDYSKFDSSKCGAFCPRVRVIACVEPGGTCPNAKGTTSTRMTTTLKPTTLAPPTTRATPSATTTPVMDTAGGFDISLNNAGAEDERLKRCREQCNSESGNKAVARIDPDHGTCLCECVEGYGYSYNSPSKCTDCKAFCSTLNPFRTYDSSVRADETNDDRFLCHCKCNEWSKPKEGGGCEPDCPPNSKPFEGACKCDAGYGMKGRICVSNKTCGFGQECAIDGCRCPEGLSCEPESKYSDLRGCVAAFCVKDGNCDRRAGENCMTCPDDCGCESGLSCKPGEPGADARGCLKFECDNDGIKDEGENCRHCADAACPSGQLCLEHGEESEVKWSCLMNPPNASAHVSSATGGYVYVVRTNSGGKPVPLLPGDPLIPGDKIIIKQMPGDKEPAHVYIEWSDGKKGLVWVNRNTDVNQGSFYMGDTRTTSHLEPQITILSDGSVIDRTEAAFPPERHYLGLNMDDVKDLSLFLVVDVLAAHPAAGVPNPVTVPLSMLLRPDSMGHTPMTFVNIKSKVLLEGDGKGGFTLYTFEGAPEVVYTDEDGNILNSVVVKPGEYSDISAYAPPSLPEEYDLSDLSVLDVFWTGPELAGDLDLEKLSRDMASGILPRKDSGLDNGMDAGSTGTPGPAVLMSVLGLGLLLGLVLMVFLIIFIFRKRKGADKDKLKEKRKEPAKKDKLIDSQRLDEDNEGMNKPGESPISKGFKYCTECGTCLEKDANYCTSCGKKQERL